MVQLEALIAAVAAAAAALGTRHLVDPASIQLVCIFHFAAIEKWRHFRIGKLKKKKNKITISSKSMGGCVTLEASSRWIQCVFKVYQAGIRLEEGGVWFSDIYRSLTRA